MKEFIRGGSLTYLEDGWCINYDSRFELKYFLYHYCLNKFGNKDYHLLIYHDEESEQRAVCSTCYSKPPDHILGYITLCRST